MPYDPNAPIERIETPKAEVAVDSTTAAKTPVEPAATGEVLSTEVSWTSPTMVNHLRMTADIDNAVVLRDIGALKESEAQAFKNYCRNFDTRILPRGIAAWYESASAETRIVWLFLRWSALKSQMKLSGFIPIRGLTEDELMRAAHTVISDPTIRDVHDVQVVPGLPLNNRQARELLDALMNSPKLEESFPEVVARFKKVA